MAAAQTSQTSFQFRHDEHAASLLQGLQALRSRSQLADVVLSVAGKEIPCHRNVLAACCGYFRAMFCNGHRESKEHKIVIHEVSANTMEQLVDFAYTAEVNITEANAVDLLKGANFFQILPISEACVKFLSEHLSAQNCLQIAGLGHVLSPELCDKALMHVMKEFTTVSKTREFLSVTKEQLITLISSDDLNASEETAFTAVMTWINLDSRERGKEMKELMELVRFPFMDKLYFIENVQSNEAIRKSCPDLVTETLKYQVFPGEVQSPRTCPRRASPLKEAVVIIGGTEGHYHGGTLLSDSICITSGPPSTSSWKTMTNMNWNRDSGFAVAVLGTSDIIVSVGKISTKQVWMYHAELNSWSKLAPLSSERYSHKLAVVQGKVYTIGGRNFNMSALKSVEIYDRSLNTWTAGVSLPQPRCRHAVAVVGGNIFVMGGCNAEGTSTPTVYRFSPGDSQWHPQTNMPVRACDITASAFNHNIYVAGLPTDVLCFRPSDNGGSWSVVATGSVGSSCGMTVYGGKIYIFGGQCIGNQRAESLVGATDDYGSSKVLCLNPETKSLQEVGRMPRRSYGHGCVTILKA